MYHGRDETSAGHRRSPIGKRACRGLLSFVKQILDLFVRFIEVVWNRKFALGAAENPLLRPLVEWHQLGHRSSSFGDNNFLAHGDSLQQPREVSLGLMDVNFHALMM